MKITKSLVPALLYNVGVEHHHIDIIEFQNTFTSTMAVEAISIGCKMLLHIK